MDRATTTKRRWAWATCSLSRSFTRSSSRAQTRDIVLRHGSGLLRGQLVDLARCANAALERPLDPGVVQRTVLAGEVDPPLRPQDRVLKSRLLLGREERESAASPAVAVPRMRRANLEDAPDAAMDLLDIVERLLDAHLIVHRAPLQGILAPGVRGQQDGAGGRRVRRRVVQAAYGKVGHARAAVDDAVRLLPDPLADLEQDL